MWWHHSPREAWGVFGVICTLKTDFVPMLADADCSMGDRTPSREESRLVRFAQGLDSWMLKAASVEVSAPFVLLFCPNLGEVSLPCSPLRRLGDRAVNRPITLMPSGGC